MKREVRISDEVDDAYSKMAAQLSERTTETVPVEALLSEQLERFAACDPASRFIVIPAEERRSLEKHFGGVMLNDAADIVTRVERLASLKIGGIDVKFSDTQWREIGNRARRNGRTPQEYVEMIVKEMSWRFWDCVR